MSSGATKPTSLVRDRPTSLVRDRPTSLVRDRPKSLLRDRADGLEGRGRSGHNRLHSDHAVRNSADGNPGITQCQVIDSHERPSRRDVGYLVYGGAMTTSDTPWEPPFAGTEVEHLVGALDRLRATFRWKADGLDETGLRARVGASSLTLGGLLKHLAAVEDYMFTTKLSGEPIGAPWDTMGGDGGNDWEFSSAAHDTPEQLYALWDGAVERSRARLHAALAGGGLDQLVHVSGPDSSPASLRRLVCDLIEEYGRHTGHADLLREAVDGRVGEDPPPGWRATGAKSTVNG
jgi:hypothetical protein